MGTIIKAGKDILDINIKKSVKYKAASLAGALMHVTFLIMFMVIRLYTMAIFNVFSISLYIMMWAVCEKPKFEKRAIHWITAMYSEVTVHAALCTLFLGGDTCFFLYAMMCIPVALYYLFLTCSSRVFKRGMTGFTLFTVGALVLALMYVHFCSPIYFTVRRQLSSGETDLIRAINIGFNLILLFGFSFLFILEINSLIKQLNQTNEQLNYTATHDALTGLYNRYCLNGTLSAMVKSGKPFCLVMGDIDDFKKVNDTFGHDCGDIVLRSVADVIKRNIRECDTACRWGGEEMLIIMDGSYDECYQIVSRIKSGISSMGIEHEGKPVNVSMTFGFTTSAESGSNDLDELLSTVDKRLYKGKTSGKNVIIVG